MTPVPTPTPTPTPTTGGSTGGGTSSSTGTTTPSTSTGTTTPSTSTGTTSTNTGTTTPSTSTGTQTTPTSPTTSTSSGTTTTANSFTVNGIRFSLTVCAPEYETCTFSGRRHVAYGANGSYSVRVAEWSIACGNDLFGDPIHGSIKSCYTSIDTTTAPVSTTAQTSTGTTTPTTSTTPTSPTTPTTPTSSGTTQTSTDGTVSLRLSANRITGTAPLAVHFDASDTTTTITGIHPFHHLRYSFNFWDERGQTWAISGLSKNTQTGGPIAAHVFDVPGTYTVRVAAQYQWRTMAETTMTITVQDPNSTYSQSTTCVSSASNFSGCPAGAQQLTSLPASSAFNNRRVLLRRGESFGSIGINHGARNVQVWAFGTGNKPRVSRVDIGALGPTSSAFPEDITIMDLNIQEQLAQYVTMSRLLIYNNDFSIPTESGNTQIELASALGYIVQNHTLAANQYYQPRELFVVGNYVRGTTTSAFVNMTGEGSKFVIMGNDMGTAQQHTTRIWAMNRGFVAHNALRWWSSDGIRVAIKLQSWGFGAYDDNYAVSRWTWATRKVVIANNRLGDQTDNNSFIGWASPENTLEGQGIEDVILENNLFVRGPNTNTEFILMGRRMTTRGNTRLDGWVPNINQFGNQYQVPADWNGPYYIQ